MSCRSSSTWAEGRPQETDGPYKAEDFQQNGVRRASGCERAAPRPTQTAAPRVPARSRNSPSYGPLSVTSAPPFGMVRLRAVRDTVHAATHDLEVIGPDVGDDPDVGAQHGLLGDLLQMGLQRHAFENDGLRSLPGRSADNAHLLLDAGRPPASDRHFGRPSGRMRTGWSPVVLASVRIPARRRSSAVRQVTVVLPRVPLTWIRRGMRRRRRR